MLDLLTLLPISYHLLEYIVDGSVQCKYINHIKRHNFTQIGAIFMFFLKYRRVLFCFTLCVVGILYRFILVELNTIRSCHH